MASRKRQKACNHAHREGVAKRALERQKLEIKWFAEHRNKERKAEDYRSADTENIIADIETGVIEATGSGTSFKLKTGAEEGEGFVTKKVFRPLGKEEFESCRQESKADELQRLFLQPLSERDYVAAFMFFKSAFFLTCTFLLQ